MAAAVERRRGSVGTQNGLSRHQRRTGDMRPAVTNGSAHLQVSEMQRSRLLVAAVGAVGEFGWEDASVARITQRARVSRRTFYELFENREECLVAVLQDTVAHITAEIVAADLDGLPWRERVRGGLWTILCFFDREPLLARACIVESRRGGTTVLTYRQQIIERLVEIVDEGRSEGRAEDLSVLSAHGVIGGVSEVLYSLLLKAEHEPLRDLAGELMGMIVLPYLGAATARREQRRPAPVSASTEPPPREASTTDAQDQLAALPMRLTYRTARVLHVLAEHPGQSNRQVADMVDIADQGQISKLLSRLARLGLLTNHGAAKGERNKWTLTPVGDQLRHTIQPYTLNTYTTKQVTAKQAT